MLVLVLFPALAAANAESEPIVQEGVYLFKQGRTQMSLDFFLSALRVDPKDEKALYYQAQAAHALGEERKARIRKESLEILRGSLEQAERVKRAAVLCERGQKAFMDGDFPQAKAHFRESYRTFAKHPCITSGLDMIRETLERKRALNEIKPETMEAGSVKVADKRL